MNVSHGLNITIPDPPGEDGRKEDGGWKYPTGRYDWIKPYALAWGEWDEWKADMKERYPIRYFIHESLPDIWGDIWKYGIVRFCHDWKWKVLHRYHPKHRYHVVDTGLKPGYYDPSNLMFHATFKLLVDFVENNIKWDRVDWEGDDDGHAKAWKEMNELVDWYKNIRPIREEIFDQERPEPNVGMNRLFNDKYKDDPDVIAYRKFLTFYTEKEVEWEKDDEDNFIRVIKLRPYLWYA